MQCICSVAGGLMAKFPLTKPVATEGDNSLARLLRPVSQVLTDPLSAL